MPCPNINIIVNHNSNNTYFIYIFSIGYQLQGLVPAHTSASQLSHISNQLFTSSFPGETPCTEMEFLISELETTSSPPKVSFKIPYFTETSGS